MVEFVLPVTVAQMRFNPGSKGLVGFGALLVEITDLVSNSYIQIRYQGQTLNQAL